MTFIRIMMSFAFLRDTNFCIRGPRSRNQSTVNTCELNFALVNCENQCVSESKKTIKFKYQTYLNRLLLYSFVLCNTFHIIFNFLKSKKNLKK